MRALVTGATGFVGPHLVAHLRASGDDVVGLDDGVVEVCDPAAVTAWLDRHRPEVVYHLAGWADVGGSWAAPQEAFRVNAEGTLNVLQARARRRVPARAGRVERRRVRHRPRGGPADHRGAPAAAGEPVRGEQGGGRLPRVAGVARPPPRGRARARLQPPRPRAERPVRRAGDRGAHRRQRSRRRRRDPGRQPRRPPRPHRRARRRPRLPARSWSVGEPGEAYNVCSGADVEIAELAERLLSRGVEADAPRRRPRAPPPRRRPRAPRGRRRSSSGRRDGAREIPLDQTLADVLDDWRSRQRACSCASELGEPRPLRPASPSRPARQHRQPAVRRRRDRRRRRRRSTHARSFSHSASCSSTSVWRAATGGSRSALAIG